jgi:hypothetical protein
VKKTDVAQELAKAQDEQKMSKPRQNNYRQDYNNDQQQSRTPNNNRETASQSNPQIRKQGYTNYDYTKQPRNNSKPQLQGQ